MEYIQHKLENIIYSYDANQFMPIWDMDGKLTNRNKFIAYKAKRVARVLGQAVEHIVETAHNR